jgi:hypothetical protein
MADEPTDRRHRSGAPFNIAEDDPRIPALAAVIAERLRPLRREMPEPAFTAMTRAIARTKLRWG